MSLMRSPTSGSSRDEAKGSSQPDLSRLNDDELQNITNRNYKRKQPHDDLSGQFQKFQDQISALLTNFTSEQREMTVKIRDDVTSINEQLKDIKSTTNKLVQEQEILKTEITNLKISNSTTAQKINTLQTDVDQLKTTSNTAIANITPNLTYCEDVLSEIQERCQRNKNLVIAGISELHSVNATSRHDHDKEEIIKTISNITVDCPQPIKIHRLGKYNNKKSRPIKIYYASEDVPKYILRNKSKLSDKSIKIYPDQTPQQQSYLENLRKELQQRTENGETDLCIKYLKGVPKIIQAESKNGQ